MIRQIYRTISIAFLFVLALPCLPRGASADGYEVAPSTPKVKRRAARPAPAAEPEVPPPPSCVSRSQQPKIRIVSWDPKQKAEKFIAEITECVTTQWDMLKMLSGPNIINVEYPSEKEHWEYHWLWSYKLQNPIGNTLIMMDNPGKRIMKGKNPVELSVVFNKDDVVEKVSMVFIKKKNSEY